MRKEFSLCASLLILNSLFVFAPYSSAQTATIDQPHFRVGTALPAATCVPGAMYLRNQSSPAIRQLYVCDSTNHWVTSSYQSGTFASRPTACSQGQLYLALNTNTVYFCSVTGNPGTWVGSAQGPQGIPGATGPAGTNGTNGIDGINGAISRIQNGGVNLPVRPTVNFVSGCSDNAGNNRTDCTGGATAAGPIDAIQTNLSGILGGYAGFIFNPTAGFTGTMNNSGDRGDPNAHIGFRHTCTTAIEGLNFGFPNDECFSIESTFTKGFNDSWQTSKATLIGLLNQVVARASGQRFSFANSLKCLGMGDCYATTQDVTQYGGLNDNGGEGTGHARFTLTQGTELATSSITSVPAQSHCTGTITQTITKSTGQATQLVNFTKTSGAGTCLIGEYIDIDRAGVFVDTNHEVTLLTTGYTGTQIGAVFESNHNINAPVLPATVLIVGDVHLMGEGRYFVNLSTTPHSGTISSITGHTVTVNDVVAANTVGGDAVLPGCWMATQDDYTGPPFNSITFNTTLHSFYAMLGATATFNIAHKNPPGFADYTGYGSNGGGYKIFPCARIWAIPNTITVVLENNSFTWTALDVVQNATSVDGVVANTNLFSWYTPGATLYNSFYIGNSGPRSWQAAISVDSGNVTASNADVTGFGTGLSLGGLKPYGIGISINQTQQSAISIAPGVAQSGTVNSNILWITQELSRMSIGPHGNPLTTGAMSIDGGAGNGTTLGFLQFGDSSSFSNTYGSTSTILPQIQSSNNFMVTGYATASGWLGVRNNSGQGWRLETVGQGPWNFHYFDLLNSIETYPFSVFSNGPNVPKLGVSTISTNYGSSAYGFSASLWHSAAANNIGANLDIEPERGGADSPFDFVFSIYDPANNTAWPNWPAVPLRISPTGVLTFGYHNDGYGPDNYAILDPTSISAHRTYTFPDWSGRFNVSGGLTTVGALGTCNAGAEGRERSVSDASGPTWGTTLVGGGAVHVGARCDGTNWLAY